MNTGEKKFYQKSPKISSVLSRLCGFASHFPLRRVCCVNCLWPGSEMTNNPDPLRHTENQNVVETGQPKACTTSSDELGGKEFWEWCTGREYQCHLRDIISIWGWCWTGCEELGLCSQNCLASCHV